MKRRLFISIFICSFACFIFANSLSAQNTMDIFQALSEGNIQQIEQIINNGADINTKNQLGWTPLHTAVNFRLDAVVPILINSGANIDAQDNSGKTPLMLAIETNQENAINFFIQNGADVNIINNSGDNALSLAQKIGLRNTVYFLQENGANPPAQTNQPQPGAGNMRGMNRGNNAQPQPQINNNSMNSFRPNTTANVEITTDANELKVKVRAYEGLEKEIADVGEISKSSELRWTTIEEDNRERLISVERNQFEDELDLIIKYANEENAKKTSETAENIMTSRKDRMRIILREIRDYADQQSRQNTRTSSRTTRNSRTRTTTAQQTNTVQEEENKYDAETQSEIDQWLNANVTNVNGRISLLSNLNNQMLSEINSLKAIATEEKAEKTLVVIDSLLVARQNRYNIISTALRGETEQQGTTTVVQPVIQPIIDPMIDPMYDPMYQGQGQYNQNLNPMYNNGPRGGQPNMNQQRGNMNRRGR